MPWRLTMISEPAAPPTRRRMHADWRSGVTYVDATMRVSCTGAAERRCPCRVDRSRQAVRGAARRRDGACSEESAKDGYLGHIFEPQSWDGTRSAHVAPLYPMMVASMFRIFGFNTFAGRAAQEALAIIGTVLGFALLPTTAQRLRLPRAAGWIAAFGLAVLPINLWVEASGGWEQPYSALILLAIVLLFCRAVDDSVAQP